jgi:hypothetical protein
MLGPNRLGEDKLFGCISEHCDIGSVEVGIGTPEGSIIFHKCGAQAILTFDGRLWSLRVNENEGVKMAAHPQDLGTGQFIKKKRGRPKKVQALVDAQVLSDEQRERDTNVMKGVEADCPHDISSKEGLEWCETEFNIRKAKVEEQLAVTKLAKATPVKEEPEFDKEFIKEATASDKRIDKNLRKGSESFFEAVKELIDNGDKGYFKALGFKSFDKYRESKTEYSRSHIGQGIQVYKALHGKIDDEKFMALPMPTAVLLTKIPESKLTNELVDEVGGMTIQEFKEKRYPELAGQLVDGTTGQPVPTPQEEFSWINRLRVHSQVADRWKKLLDVARWKASGLVDEHDVYSNFDQTEKAIICIYLECCKSSGWEDEYNEAQQTPLVDAAF